jgi:hypothetical protein
MLYLNCGISIHYNTFTSDLKKVNNVKLPKGKKFTHKRTPHDLIELAEGTWAAYKKTPSLLTTYNKRKN